MLRKIIRIDEEKCNGCGDCVPSCAEGAIQVINGKARLVKDQYCDGLGACLGDCPTGALTIEEREAEAFDEEAAMEHVKTMQKAPEKPQRPGTPFSGCPGMQAREIKPRAAAGSAEVSGEGDIAFSVKPQLEQWPVQLALVPTKAPYFEYADLLVTADCVPFAYADYHPRMLKGKRVVVGCPKLDNTDLYTEKLTAILRTNNIRSLTVAFMEVPCCGGIVQVASQALQACGKDIPFRRIKVGIDGGTTEM